MSDAAGDRERHEGCPAPGAACSASAHAQLAGSGFFGSGLGSDTLDGAASRGSPIADDRTYVHVWFDQLGTIVLDATNPCFSALPRVVSPAARRRALALVVALTVAGCSGRGASHDVPTSMKSPTERPLPAAPTTRQNIP